jgi:DNA-binding protein HU-beta/integration host factor subunit alpha
MTKKEIVLKIAEEAELKQIDVKKVVQRVLDHIVESLTKGETVELRNFGIFKVKSRKPRVGRNPKTGATVPIPEKRIVTFKSGMVMKKKVMKEKTHV